MKTDCRIPLGVILAEAGKWRNAHGDLYEPRIIDKPEELVSRFLEVELSMRRILTEALHLEIEIGKNGQ